MEPLWSHLIFCWGLRRQFGAKWHQNWCHLEPLTYSQWAKPFIKVFLKKTSKNSVAAQESGYCPSLSPWLKAILCPPSKRFLHLTHGWRSFCQPIRWEILLQSLTATFAAEKRHDFWKNIPTILYRNFQSRKTTHFPKLFQKSFLLLYRKFFRSNLNPYFKNFFSTTVTGTFAVLSGTQIAKKA